MSDCFGNEGIEWKLGYVEANVVNVNKCETSID